MVEFELTNPFEESFLVGIELVDGITEDIEPGEETQVTIFSIGLLFFRINYLTIKN